ncbi:Centromere/kinetochore Zw10-domain-containing protein [Cladochytrium replicatum]|nr:Centromere/kinetochore Zw10-domain-containing protein [Cladochytrium replicatum]
MTVELGDDAIAVLETFVAKGRDKHRTAWAGGSLEDLVGRLPREGPGAYVDRVRRDVEARIQDVQFEMDDRVASEKREFTKNMGVICEAGAKTVRLARDLEAETRTLQDPVHGGAFRELDKLLSERIVALETLNQVDRDIEVLEGILEVNRILRSFESALEVGNFLEAARLTVQMDHRISSIPNPDTVEIVIQLKDKVENAKIRFREVIEYFLSEMLIISPSTNTITIVVRLLVQVCPSTKRTGVHRVAQFRSCINTRARYTRRTPVTFSRRLLKEVLLKVVQDARWVVIDASQEEALGHVAGWGKNDRPPMKLQLRRSADRNSKSWTERSDCPFSLLTGIFTFLKSALTSFSDESSSNSDQVSPIVLARAAFVVIGGIVWRDLSDRLVHEYLTKMIPTTGDALGSFDSVVERVWEFEDGLVAEGLISFKQTVLINFCNDVDKHFAVAMRTRLHEAVRKILCEDDKFESLTIDQAPLDVGILLDYWNGTKAEKEGKYEINTAKILGLSNSSGEAGVILFDPKQLRCTTDFSLRFPKCTVSVKAARVVELIRNALKEVLKIRSGECARYVLLCIRDAFDLFRALRSVQSTNDLSVPPGVGMVVHNDYMYLAHTAGFGGLMTRAIVVGLCSQNKTDRTSPALESDPGPQSDGWSDAGVMEDDADTETDEATGFVDLMVALTREAEGAFSLVVTAQRENLKDILNDADGLSVADDKRYAHVERILKQVVHQLKHLSSVWKPLLPKRMHLKSMSLLIRFVLQTATHEVLELTDIGDEETLRLNGLLSRLWDFCVEIFEFGVKGRDANDTGRLATRVMTLAVGMTVCARYRHVTDMLDSRFADIMDRFREGGLVEFDVRELASFVKAVFADSELRRRNVDEILRGHP